MGEDRMSSGAKTTPKRIVTAVLKHETNTFSPIPADKARFEAFGLFHGDDAITAKRGTKMPLAAYIEAAEAIGAEIVCPIDAEAMPSGPVTDAFFKEAADAIVAAVEDGCDAILLDLHGAMVTENHDDGEGELLERVRAAAPDTPIAVTCDLHCNLTDKMGRNCTALIGYKTYPHVDMYDVAGQVAAIVLDGLSGKVDPVMRWGRIPLLSQTLRQGTDDEPMKSVIARCRKWEEHPKVLSATAFGGFQLADIHDAGNSAVVVTDGDPELADEAVEDINALAWSMKDAFIYTHHDRLEALAKARSLNDGPVILLDHCDNCGSGATQDVMDVVSSVITSGLDDVVVATVWDPGAVELMRHAGLGRTIEIDLGGKTDMPAIKEEGHPLRLTGTIDFLCDGKFTVEGPMYTGVVVDCGPTALFRVGGTDANGGKGVRIIVTSHHHEPWDAGVVRMVGIDPERVKYLLLKSLIHYRAGFGTLARHTFTLDGTGVTVSDNNRLPYSHIRRPIFPLDETIQWP